MKTFSFIVAAALLTLANDAAWGHPGHGTTPPEGVAHYFFEPSHVLPPALLFFAVCGVIYHFRRARKRLTRRLEGAKKPSLNP